MAKVMGELQRAQKKFPPFASPHEGWAIIWEELDEMWEEVRKNDRFRAKEEAVQVAAMAIRYLIDIKLDVPTNGQKPA